MMEPNNTEGGAVGCNRLLGAFTLRGAPLAWRIGRLAWCRRFWWQTLHPNYGRGALYCLDGTFAHIAFGFMWKRSLTPNAQVKGAPASSASALEPLVRSRP